MPEVQGSVDAVLTYLKGRTGLTFPPVRLPFVEQLVRDAMRRSKVTGPAAFLDFLTRNAVHEERLIADLTVGETYFFRHPEQLEMVRGTILPSIVGARSAEVPIRVWSAGCATGEEAYTLAIMLDQQKLGESARVLGTDISQARLRHARHARYRAWSFRDMPPEILRAYFNKRGDKYDLIASIRTGVEFRQLNLVEDTYPWSLTGISEMDLILCRNVLMYFSEEVIARVAERLIGSLSADGWLVLGAADPMLNERVECEVVMTPAGPAYRRPARHSAGTSLASPVSAGISSAGVVSVEGIESGKPPGRTRSTPERPVRPRIIEPGPLRAPIEPMAVDDPSPVLALVRGLADEGKMVLAEAAVSDALRRLPLSADLHALHATLLTQLKQGPAAIEAARRAVYLDRSFVIAHIALADALLLGGARRAAARALRNARVQLAGLAPGSIVRGSTDEPASRVLATVDLRLDFLKEAE